MHYLNDEDTHMIVQFLHEMEHAFDECYLSPQNCMVYRRAVENAGKGLLLAVDALVARKVADHG